MGKLLITGFTPFDGRSVNGSWIAAQTFAGAHHLEIPVVWGAPLPALETEVQRHSLSMIVSLGEGREGFFDIETRAKNTRNQRLDNQQQYPCGKIMADGPDQRLASIDAAALLDTLAGQDIPIRLSADAGQFLCEETLYSLEYLKTQYDCLHTVVFVHLPPHGTSLTYRGATGEADESLYRDFVARLIKAIDVLHVAENTEIASHHSQNRG